MRLWTLHPRYLDAKGLVGAWREALLAQKVLRGATKGYRNHPQLQRFRSHPKPQQAIAAFLGGLLEEAARRGYRFDKSKISSPRFRGQLDETQGQLLYEWEHLRRKLHRRAPAAYRQWSALKVPEAHPFFRMVPGKVREWEKR